MADSNQTWYDGSSIYAIQFYKPTIRVGSTVLNLRNHDIFIYNTWYAVYVSHNQMYTSTRKDYCNW